MTTNRTTATVEQLAKKCRELQTFPGPHPSWLYEFPAIAEKYRRMEEAAIDMLKAGQHEGPCTNEGDDEEPCRLHLAAYERRKKNLEDAIAFDPLAS